MGGRVAVTSWRRYERIDDGMMRPCRGKGDVARRVYASENGALLASIEPTDGVCFLSLSQTAMDTVELGPFVSLARAKHAADAVCYAMLVEGGREVGH